MLVRPKALTLLPEKFYVLDASIFPVSMGSLASLNIQEHSCTGSVSRGTYYPQIQA